jgi:hypothetical protein
MNPSHFDAWTRRQFGLAVSSALAAMLGMRSPELVRAKKRQIKLQRNAFGCVDVGGKCRGSDAYCCSGICEGKKPKQGKKDTSRCVAHDGGTGCRAGQIEDGCADGVADIACTTNTGQPGVCNTTTGNAAYCVHAASCDVACQKDADCRELCGSAAACIVCNGCLGGTACVSSSAGGCGAEA